MVNMVFACKSLSEFMDVKGMNHRQKRSLVDRLSLSHLQTSDVFSLALHTCLPAPALHQQTPAYSDSGGTLSV